MQAKSYLITASCRSNKPHIKVLSILVLFYNKINISYFFVVISYKYYFHFRKIIGCFRIDIFITNGV